MNIEPVEMAFSSGVFVGIFAGMWLLFVAQWAAKKIGKYFNVPRCGDGF